MHEISRSLWHDSYEEAEIYQIEPARSGEPAVWSLILDYLQKDRATSPGPQPISPAASSSPTKASSSATGAILPLSAAEYKIILARWPGNSVVRFSLLGQPKQTIRHSRFRLRLYENVTPADDGRWLLAAGPDGARDTVSFRSINQPDLYLKTEPPGVIVGPVSTNANCGAAIFALHE